MRPRLKRTIEAIEDPEGNLILMRTAAPDVRIERPDEGERRLLEALDGSRTVEELEARLPGSDVRETITAMRGLGLIEDACDDKLVPAAARERFDRQLRYFSDLAASEAVAPSRCQARLREAKAAVLGVGGLGGRVAWDLACCGIGEMWLVDCDRVEVSNLNRQIQFVEADIGRLKAEATAERIRSFNSAVTVRATAARIEGQQELAEFVGGADIVVEAADWPAHEIEHWCNAACFELGVPYISMSHFPPVARFGPLYVPGETGCFACQVEQYRREYPLFDVAVEQRRGKPSPSATFGPACGVVGGIVAAEIVHFLTGLVTPATLAAGFACDMRTLEMERYEVVPEPGCAVCSSSREAVVA